jgi:sodium transport system permease protein
MWRIVLKKEFFEVFRDPRTRFNIIVSPLLITPLILALVGGMARKQATEARTEQVTVGIVNAESAPTLSAALDLDGAKNVHFVRVTRAEAETKIKDRTLRAALLVPDNADPRLADQQSVPLPVLFDPSNEPSQQGASRLKEFLRIRGDVLVAQRLQENGLSIQLARPFDVGDAPISGAGGAGMMMLSVFLPYILALSTIMGGVFVANDAVAGEKERGTLETLLVSPVSRRDLVLGKFLTVASVSLVSSVLSLVGMLWPFTVKLPIFAWMSDGGIVLSPLAGAAMLLVQVPLAVLGAGVLLAVSTFARNQKESQTYLTPVLLIASVCAMMSMLVKSSAPLYWALVPITNAALILKQALENHLDPAFVAIACAASLVYAAIAVVFAIQLFQKESVLLKA